MGQGTHHVTIHDGALKNLRKLDPVVRRRVTAAIDRLATDPRPSGCRPLTGYTGLYRVRVGDYRIVYEIKDAELVVHVIRIGHRREIYR